MPQRILGLMDLGIQILRASVGELVYVAGALVLAVTASLEAATSLAGNANGWGFEVFAYVAGFAADLMFRAKAYHRLPVEERRPLPEEWASRLGFAAVGLCGAVFMSLLVHRLIELNAPELAQAAYPISNFFLVLIAVPVIDFIRGVFRMGAGKSAQEAFAGLVIDWARHKSGADRGDGS
jgi:hypothetical protein